MCDRFPQDDYSPVAELRPGTIRRTQNLETPTRSTSARRRNVWGAPSGAILTGGWLSRPVVELRLESAARPPDYNLSQIPASQPSEHVAA